MAAERPQRAARLPEQYHEPLRDLVLALTLGALWLIRIWAQLLTYSKVDTYVMREPPTSDYLYGAVINVLLLGGVFWGLITFARRKLTASQYRFAQFCFLVSLIVPVNGARALLATQFDYLRSPLFEIIPMRYVEVLSLLLSALAIAAVLRWLRFFKHIASRVLLILSPFVLLTCGQALWRATHNSDAAFRNSPLAPPLSTAGHQVRAIWMIADEWDYRLSFVNRPPAVHLPEIDRLRKEAFFASNAYSPANQTIISVPSLIVGRRVRRSQAMGTSHLQLWFWDDPNPVSFTAVPNFFERLRQEGMNTALVGWYLPYCRSFSSDLTSCEWWPQPIQSNSYGDTLAEVVPSQIRSLVETNVLSAFGQALAARHAGQIYSQWLERAKADVAQANFDFVYIHAPVPHSPFAYDAAAGTFTRGNSLTKGYLDNLVLLDRTIGALRAELERSGLWDRTALLISSDHHYRESQALDGKTSPLIPFVLKMPHQTATFPYERAFNTVLTGDLLLDLMRGKVSTPEQAARWITARQAGADPR